MKRKVTVFFAAIIAIVATLGITACNSAPHECSFDSAWSNDSVYHYHKCIEQEGCSKVSDKQEHQWDGGVIVQKATKQANGIKKFTCEVCEYDENRAYQLQEPSSAQVYTARQEVVNDAIKGYDFKLTLECNLDILNLGTSVSGIYEGQYRQNQITGNETFKRTASGALFFDGTEYSYTHNNQKIKLVMDDDNTVKKSSVIRNDEEEGFFINKTLSGLIDIMQASNINNIDINDESVVYDFSSSLNFGAGHAYISKVTSLFSKFGTKVAFKNIDFTNPTAIPFEFTINEENRLEDFKMEFEVGISVKNVSVSVKVTYEQNGANNPISIPQSDIITDNAQISNIVSTVNGKLAQIKNNEDYSLDIVASNEFDPAWNKLAIVDKYIGRMYKNTDGSNVWFNHSYEYKAHHEEDGSETYKYTIGNIQDGTVHLVSRKGSNAITQLNAITVDTQFDYIVSPFIFSPNEIDCIKHVEDEGITTYYLHLNSESAKNIQNKIVEIINSNDAEGVVDVDNYLNQNITIKNAEFVIVMENGNLKEISIETDLKYNPTAGEYTDYNITLTDKLELLINNKLSQAEDYEAPNKAAATLGFGGLGYIL